MAEQTVIELPNGAIYRAVVTQQRGWTRIVPERSIPVQPSGLGEELGDTADYIHDMDVRGDHPPEEMVRLLISAWLRDSGWSPESADTPTNNKES